MLTDQIIYLKYSEPEMSFYLIYLIQEHLYYW